MNIYTITLAHDNGTISITTTNKTKTGAVRTVLSYEGAPFSAITKIKSNGPMSLRIALVSYENGIWDCPYLSAIGPLFGHNDQRDLDRIHEMYGRT